MRVEVARGESDACGADDLGGSTFKKESEPEVWE
jgi:hypothetical protein